MRQASLAAYLGRMDTRNSDLMHFVSEAYRHQLDLELRATRGRSTWRAPKPKPRRSRRLFSFSFAPLARA
jgi:hypothetical protein